MSGQLAERPPHGPRLLQVRLDGLPDAVAFAAERVRMVLDVVRESPDYRNRPPQAEYVRRYLDVVVEGAELLAEEAGR